MKICFVVRSAYYQRPTYTTSHLAYEAWKRGHTVVFANINSLTFRDPGKITAMVTAAGPGNFRDTNTYLEGLQSEENRRFEVCLNDFDVVFLRYNPHGDTEIEISRSNPGLEFGRLLKLSGVLVLNDPGGLAKASSKMYLSSFPEEVRAQTLITRSALKIKDFVKRLRKPVILKPLTGYGGQDVFFIKDWRDININQIIATVSKSGYVIAQEFLPAVKQGDKRLLLLNGEPIFVGKQVAMYRRMSPKGEIRSNMHIGGRRNTAKFTRVEARIAEMVQPKLIADGLYFVGVDIVGDKVLEINAFCPGGIHNINELYGINVGEAVIRDLEKRVQVRGPALGVTPPIRSAV
jgi:glutathione synthase